MRTRARDGRNLVARQRIPTLRRAFEVATSLTFRIHDLRHRRATTGLAEGKDPSN